MAGNDFERTIGELSGQLGMLVPTLERFEERQRQAENAAERARTELSQVRKERDQDARKASQNFDELFKFQRKLEKEDERLEGRISVLEGDLALQKTRRTGTGKRVWEIVLILLSGALGALFTKLMG